MNAAHDPDTQMRVAAFEQVRRLGEIYDHLTATQLKPGFLFQGERIGASNKSWMIAWPPMLLAHFAWSIFWGITTYRYGLWLNQGQTFLILLWVYLAAWLTIAVVRYYRTSALVR